jgi:5-formyltetrahydrofolate cyclo-ligase
VDLADAKRAVRDRVWAALDAAGTVDPPGAAGHIPSFIGADEAARRLADLEVWQRAAVVKSNPDRAQLPVRKRALDEGKLVYMAVPRMATLQPFYELDPTQHGREVADSKRAKELVRTVGPDQMRPVDLVVCGSVAVDRQGVRIGKGAGYSDLEVALLVEAGLVSSETTICTTVHDLQVVDEELPEADHDFRVDLIITPTELIECGPPRRPTGILRDALRPEQLASIPVLGSNRGRRA